MEEITRAIVPESEGVCIMDVEARLGVEGTDEASSCFTVVGEAS